MRMGSLADEVADTRPWYTRVRDWVADSAVVNAATAGRDYAVDEAKRAIEDLYNRGLEFQQTLSQLAGYQNVAYQSSDLRAQYDELMSRGANVNAVIRSAVASVQGIAAWVRQNMGVDLDTPPQPFLGSLGFVQVIPLAIIGGVVAATALAAAWIVDARSAITRLEAMQSLIESVPPDQRAGVLDQMLQQSGGITGAVSSIKGLLIVGAVIAAGIYFAPQLKRLTKR